MDERGSCEVGKTTTVSGADNTQPHPLDLYLFINKSDPIHRRHCRFQSFHLESTQQKNSIGFHTRPKKYIENT